MCKDGVQSLNLTVTFQFLKGYVDNFNLYTKCFILFKKKELQFSRRFFLNVSSEQFQSYFFL